MKDTIYRADETFCKSQFITCNRVKECNGVCPFEDALKHADKTQTMNEQTVIDHDRDWIIGCLEHDGFIHTHRFDKANQIIHDALSAEQGWIPCSERLPKSGRYLASCLSPVFSPQVLNYDEDDGKWFYDGCKSIDFELLTVIAWMPLPKPYKGGEDE
jgi:hypothetical protein